MRHRWGQLLLLICAALWSACFPRTAGPRLAHFDQRAPRVGAAAPDFTLRDVDGATVSLSDLVGERPVVLQLGSHTCPVYRYRRHWMDDLIADYGDRVDFRIVYTLEAHPKGSKSPYAEGIWVSLPNRVSGVLLPQPATFEERLARARFSRDRLGLDQSVLVDGMDNRVWSAYGAASSPAFVLDRHGTVALAQVWIEPREIRAVLDRLLADTRSSPARDF